MGSILFWLAVIASFSMLLLPLLQKSRGKALLTWIGQVGGVLAFSFLLDRFYPNFVEPAWAQNTLWRILGWAFLVGGFVIAMRKPAKSVTV